MPPIIRVNPGSQEERIGLAALILPIFQAGCVSGVTRSVRDRGGSKGNAMVLNATATCPPLGRLGLAEPPRWLLDMDATAGWLSREEAIALHAYAAEVETGAIIEVGSYRGRSTIALSAGARPGIPVYAIEPHEAMSDACTGTFGPDDRGEFYKSMLRSEAYRNVRLLNVSSEVVTPGWTTPVGLLWIDGDHSEPGVRRDWACWRPHLAPGATVVFDNAHNSAVGPMSVIAELVEAGLLEHRKSTGKMRALVYRGA